MLWQPNVSYEFGPFRVDPRERRLLRDGQVVPLRPKVFDVLLVLVQNSGRFLSKHELMKLVWRDTVVEEGNLARNISSLRNALSEHPRTAEYIETVPWQGYRFVARVKELTYEPTRVSINSLAVLPFVNVANDPNLDYLADGIAETLINQLSQLPQLMVVSRNSTFRYKGRESETSVIARELNAQALLVGRIVKHQELLSISVELVDARDDSHIWGAQYIRKPLDLFAIQQTISEEISDKLRPNLTFKDQTRLERRYTDSPEAYQLYLKGRYYFNKLNFEGVEKGIEYHKQAIEKDPHFALAYAALADCHNYFAQPAHAKEALSRALELDETLGEAHATRGFFKFIYDWDFAGAEADFERAVELNPNYAEAHHWSAIYFGNMGRHEVAAAEAKKAVELDPLSLLMNTTLGLTAYLARDHDRAIAELQNVLDMDSSFVAAHSVLGNAYLQRGQFDNAMAEYQKVLELSKGATPVETSMKAIIAHAYAKSGKRGKARKLLNELLAPSARSKETTLAVGLIPHLVAEIYGALGQKDDAFGWLNRAYEQHDMQMVSLKVNPTVDPLRSDPRFAELVRRVGLPN
ncbi:MAG TPA: winged helix-turn-helix domain-containing protein [Pyrinomonadaceae bacterium]|nr:winged helix-turn-helix domain-containing protein [Pyrinomonadaceae bacterium]